MSPQASWLLVNEIVPRLASAVPHAVRTVGAEDSEELIQDATCMAAKLLMNAEAAGKQVTPGNIAYYTLQHCKSGRRSVGYSNADVLGSATQLNGRSKVSSLDYEIVVEDEPAETFTVNDVLAGEQDDPSVVAARKLDWEVFCSRQDTRTLIVIQAIAEGEPLTEAADELGVSYNTVREIKMKVAAALIEFMGADVLTECIRQPKWRADILATRERHACQLERR